MGIVFSGKYEQGYALVRPDQKLLLELKMDSALPKLFKGPLSLKCREQRWPELIFDKGGATEEVIDISAWDEGSGNIQWEPVCHRVGLRSFGHTRYKYYTDPQFANIPDRSFSIFSTTYSTISKVIWLIALIIYVLAWWAFSARAGFELFDLFLFLGGLSTGAIVPICGKLFDLVTNKTASGQSLPFFGVFLSAPRAAFSVIVAFLFALLVLPCLVTRVENLTDDTLVLTLPNREGGVMSLALPPHSSEVLLCLQDMEKVKVRAHPSEEGRGFYAINANDRGLSVAYSTAKIECDPVAVKKLNAFFGLFLSGDGGASTASDRKSCIVKRELVLSKKAVAAFVGEESFVGDPEATNAELHFQAPYDVVAADPKQEGEEHPLMSEYHSLLFLKSDIPSERDDALAHVEADIASARAEDWFARSRVETGDGHPIGPVYIPIKKNRPIEISMTTRTALGEANREKLFCVKEDDSKGRATPIGYMEIVDGAGRPLKVSGVTFKQTTNETPARYSVLWRVENENPSSDAFVCVPRMLASGKDAELSGRVTYKDENREEYNFSKATMKMRDTRIELRIEDTCFVYPASERGEFPAVKMSCKTPCNRSPDPSLIPMVDRIADISELECMRYEYCGNCKRED